VNNYNIIQKFENSKEEKKIPTSPDALLDTSTVS
jgi:hypothetical protein